MMRTDDFDYELPTELIAQKPAEPRDSCRLLVLDKDSGEVEHRVFTDIIDYLNSGDLMVVNDTRVMMARLNGCKPQTGGSCEFLLLNPCDDDPDHMRWECLVKPGRRLKPGAEVYFFEGGINPYLDDKTSYNKNVFSERVQTARSYRHQTPDVDLSQARLKAVVCEHTATPGGRVVRFEPAEGLSLIEAFHVVGKIPLPPYITEYEGDPENYQTVYAQEFERSAAAPTAGLHFTPELLEKCRAKGVDVARVELEVGIDTFRIVTEENILDHEMHTERYHVPQETVDKIVACKERGSRVIAIGTTTVRSLESAWDHEAGMLRARESETTQLFLYPGSTFHVIDAMVTNFHVPRSTLMMLVSALATREYIMNAYQQAVEKKYRMLSFGDAMLIK